MFVNTKIILNFIYLADAFKLTLMTPLIYAIDISAYIFIGWELSVFSVSFILILPHSFSV